MKRIPESAYVEISRKKPLVPVDDDLRRYLTTYHRRAPFTLAYEDLLAYHDALPVQDEDGHDTLWNWVLYAPPDWKEFSTQLSRIYAWLKTPSQPDFTDHLHIERVEYCDFGNSHPFRVRVVNRYNDNHDYYYVKRADASRIFGLELEHILAPNRIDFLVNGSTLIEEHITGVPGDRFISRTKLTDSPSRVRIAKEFVKFSERSFTKLLGDMRSYNYVVVITQDFDAEQIRVRAIDFDQQSYEGSLSVYLPQFYRDNQPIVGLVWEVLSPQSIRQYQAEERSLIARRRTIAGRRLDDLLGVMEQTTIASPKQVRNLARGLSRYHGEPRFLDCTTMGALTTLQLATMTRPDKLLLP